MSYGEFSTIPSLFCFFSSSFVFLHYYARTKCIINGDTAAMFPFALECLCCAEKRYNSKKAYVHKP